MASSSGRQPNFAVLNRGCHLYSAGRPSRWALAHISGSIWFCFLCTWWNLCFTTLYAVGNILRVHYKSMKCDVSFSQGSVSMLFKWGEHVFHICVKMFFKLTAVPKLLKNQTSFSRVMITNVLPRFSWITVYKPFVNTTTDELFRLLQN